MQDGMPNDPTKESVKVMSTLKLEIVPFSKSISTIYDGSWQMTIDSTCSRVFTSLQVVEFCGQ